MANTLKSFDVIKAFPMAKEGLLEVLDFYQHKAINGMATATEPLIMGQNQGMYQLVQMLKERLR